MKIRSTALALGAVACVVATVAVRAQRPRPEAQMAEAAKAFLASLDAGEKAKAEYPFTSDERLNWHFIPKTRNGLPLKAMTPDQQKAALHLLQVSLSQSGYDKAAAIRSLENILLAQEKGKGPLRDPQNYFFTVFGEPSADGTWAWRYEGHHCAQNFTIVKGKGVASTPQFFGTNPAEVRDDVPGAPPKGTRVLGRREDLARTLVKSLSAEQKPLGVVSEKAPNDIATAADRQAAIQQDTGISFSKLTADQQAGLRAIVQEYASAMIRPLAEERMAKIRTAGWDKVKFAWMGGLERGEPHYYRVQGPTFLIEYDNTQNNANHVHSVWRDFRGDFGMDLLAMHYQQYPHRVAQAK